MAPNCHRRCFALASVIGVVVIALAGVANGAVATKSFLGDAAATQRLAKMQREATIRVRDAIAQDRARLAALVEQVMKMDTSFFEPAKVEALPPEPAGLDPNVLWTPAPLHPDVTPHLVRYAVESAAFARELRVHRSITLGRARARLEALAHPFWSHKRFAVRYTPRPADTTGPYVPPVGELVGVLGKPIERRPVDSAGPAEYDLPVADRAGKETVVPMRHLLQISKSNFLENEGELAAYSRRVRELKRQAKQVAETADVLADQLDRHTGR